MKEREQERERGKKRVSVGKRPLTMANRAKDARKLNEAEIMMGNSD